VSKLAPLAAVVALVAAKPTARIDAGGGAIWAVADGQAKLLRIDPATNSVTGRTAVGRRPLFAALGAGSVWVALLGAVLRISRRRTGW
jgi:virginiamycin B lyase